MKKAIVMIFVLALAVSALAFAGCGGSDSSSADSPEQVVEKFMAATMAEDADAVYNLLSEDSQAEVTDKQSLVEGSAEALDSYEVGKATVSGETARVSASLVLKDLEATLDFEVVLVKEGGAWRISLSETGASMDEAFDKLMEDLELPE